MEVEEGMVEVDLEGLEFTITVDKDTAEALKGNYLFSFFFGTYSC